jgi:hypothetical protein
VSDVPDAQADREATLARRHRFSPAARYYPTYRAPLLDDGALDVRAWCADLDTWFNQGLSGG